MPKNVVKYTYSEQLIKQADKNPAVKGRASLTHELIKSYHLLQHMEILSPIICKLGDLKHFHQEDYVQQFAKHAEPAGSVSSSDSEDEFQNASLSRSATEEYGLGFDCPLWPSIQDYVCSIAGATMTACDLLAKQPQPRGRGDIILNWTGGWHHAHRDKAGGYCYVNDIVLGILMLRKRYRRILYVDLDVHHGDGVEEAFATTKRVFTLSFHKHECGFYPGSGDVSDLGLSNGKGYAANFPYKSGIIGDNFRKYFKRIFDAIYSRYQPEALCIQCGADALAGDPLGGGTNLMPSDLIACVLHILKSGLPAVILGGGGYHFTNASRFWTLLTAAISGHPNLAEDIPDDNPYFLKYGPDYSLNMEKGKFLQDLNSNEYLESCSNAIEENLTRYNVAAV